MNKQRQPNLQPSKQDADDTISRAEAIDAVYKCTDIFAGDMPVMVVKADAYEALAQMPSAQPEIIRCGQCKYAEVADKEDAQDGYTCQFHRGSVWFSGSYCSWAERRTDEAD